MKLAASLLLVSIVSIILFSCFQYKACAEPKHDLVEQVYRNKIVVEQDPLSHGYLVFDSTGTYLGRFEIHYKLVIYK